MDVSSPHVESAVASPSLAAAMPAHLLKKLQSRNGRRSIGGSPCAASPALMDKENPEPEASAQQTPSKHMSPCAREAQRMEENRRRRRLEQETARAERAEHDESAEFRAMIAQYRERIHSEPPPPTSAPSTSEALRVMVRKRPLLPAEVKAAEFDVLTCVGRKAILHQTRLKVDLERQLENHTFGFDELFGESTSTRQVYEASARPLVEALFHGQRATCFAYGQTGSGKTHTMSGSQSELGLYGLAAHDIFAALEAARGEGSEMRLCVSMYEIYREVVYDLLAPSTDVGRISVLEDAAGEVQLVGLSELEPTDAQQVLELLEGAKASRRTANNSINERSSRSHAVLTFTLKGTSGAAHGKLSLVDLAGSERAGDTLDADRESRAEGRDINMSLLSLKECIRAMDERSAHVPFRGCKLTQVLRESFTSASSTTVMIAHVAPANRSCEYSLNSLRYAERLKSVSVSSSRAKLDASEAGDALSAPSLSRKRSSLSAASSTEVVPSSPARRPPKVPGTPSRTPGAAVAGRLACSTPGGATSPAHGVASEAEATHGESARKRPALGPAPGSASKEERAVDVLKDVLRVAYDTDGWELELSYLEQPCAQPGTLIFTLTLTRWERELRYLEARRGVDLAGCFDHVEQVLAERISLFETMRSKLPQLKAKALS